VSTVEFVNVMSLVEGDRVDVGGSRRDALVVRPAWEYGTGSVSVLVVSHGRTSSVWFPSSDSTVARTAKAL